MSDCSTAVAIIAPAHDVHAHFLAKLVDGPTDNVGLNLVDASLNHIVPMPHGAGVIAFVVGTCLQ